MHFSRKFGGEIRGNYHYSSPGLLGLSATGIERLIDHPPGHSAGLTFALTNRAIIEQCYQEL
jgi:hypothetical protein